MKRRTSWIAVAAALIGGICNSQSLHAANLQISAHSSSVTRAAVPATAAFPGYLIGIIGAGDTVSGLPAFPNSTELDIPSPLAILPSGGPIQYYFSLETAGYSGNLDVAIQVIQNGVSIYSITGSLFFDANTKYVVSTNGGTVPSTTGPVELMVTVNNETLSTTSQGARVVID